MGKLSKAQARKRLDEARQKVFLVAVSGHITLEQANKAIKPISMMIDRLK